MKSKFQAKIRCAIVLGAILSAVCSNVHAQMSPDSEFAPKNYSLVDANGVDIGERNFTAGHSISIGDPADGGMSYSLSYSSSHVWMFHNSVMSHVLVTTMFDEETGNWSTIYAVQARGSMEALYFDSSGQKLLGDRGSRLNFAANGTIANVTLADGSVMLFETVPILASLTTTSRVDVYRALSITAPDGDRSDYYYESGGLGLQAIVNNHGYQLRFNTTAEAQASGLKAPTSVVLFNMAVDACAPTASTCSAFTQTWPRLTFEYYPSPTRRLKAVIDTGGGRTEYTYDAQMQRVGFVDRPGANDTTITYQNCGALPPNGQCAVGGNGGMVGGYRVSTVSRGGRTWTYAWNPAVTNAANPERGVRVTSAVGYSDYRIAVAQTFGMAWDDIYGPASRLISVRDELGRTTQMEHGGHLNPIVTKVTYPEGNGEHYTYDPRMNLASVRRFAKPGSGLADQITTIVRMESGATDQCTQPALCNKVKLIRDPRNFVRRFNWTAAGLLESEESGLQGADASLVCSFGSNLCPKTEYTYASYQAYFKNSADQIVAGSPIELVESTRQCVNTTSCAANAQVVTSLTYGPPSVANNLLVRSVAVGGGGQSLVTSYAYDAVGNRVEVDGPRTNAVDVTRFSVDLDRRLVQETQADNSASRTTFTPEGYTGSTSVGIVDGAGQFSAWQTTTYDYDASGNVVKTTSPTGVKQMSYDEVNRLVCIATRMNPNVFSTLPSDACVHSTAGVHGPDRIIRNTYNAAGELLNVLRAYGTPLQQVYASYAYTLNSKQDWLQDANGNRSDFTYDGFDRMEKQTYPSPVLGSGATNSGDYELYGYDANNNRTSLRLRSGENVVMQYDGLNRQASRDFPAGSTVDIHFAYDLLGRTTSIGENTPAGVVVSNTYDVWGRPLTEVAYGRSLSYTHDEAGNRTRMTWPDGNYVDYTFDVMNRMDQVRENGAQAGLGLLADYAYDAIGRRTTLSRGNGTATTLVYDAGSRPTSHEINVSGMVHDVNSAFSYNNASQIVSRTLSNDLYRFVPAQAVSQTYVADGLNRYQSVAGVTFTYDGRGNLLSNGSRGFSYDLQNRLVGIANAGGSSLLTLTYDPLNRLGQAISPAGTTRFLYSGEKLVAEYDGNGALTHRYVHGAGVDELLVRYEGSSLSGQSRKWVHANIQHSVVGTTNESGELIDGALSYSPYGEPDAVHGWTAGRFRFTGQLALPEASLYHFKARAYDPGLGRFLQTDPAGFKDDLNLYAYVGNDPINNMDFSGRGKIKIFLAALEKIGDSLNLSKVKRITEKEAVKVREGIKDAEGNFTKKPGNVIVEGQGSSKVAERIEKRGAGPGNEGKVDRHDAHKEDGLNHYQTAKKDGHTFYKAASALTAGAYLGEDSKAAMAIDMVNPASDVADLVELYDEAMADYDAKIAEMEKPKGPGLIIIRKKPRGDCDSKATASTPCVAH